MEKTEVLLAGSSSAPSTESLDSRFATHVQPFFKRYCYSCHGPNKRKAQLDLSRYATVKAFATEPKRLEQVLKRLQGEEMPPEQRRASPNRISAPRWSPGFGICKNGKASATRTTPGRFWPVV